MNTVSRRDNSRHIKAPTGPEISCKHWGAEAPMRMLMNNLDDEVAENPQELVVYGGIGRAARNWDCFDQIIKSLQSLEKDETLLVQSGKAVGIFRTHNDAPRVLIANSNILSSEIFCFSILTIPTCLNSCFATPDSPKFPPNF